MTRPASHRTQNHEKFCGSCVFAHLLAYKMDLLCFHGDNIEVTGKSDYPVTADHIDLDGKEVNMLDGDEYSEIWAARVVDCDDVCDNWSSDGPRIGNKVVDMNGKELSPGMEVMVHHSIGASKPGTVVKLFPNRPTTCDSGHWVSVDDGYSSIDQPSYILEAIVQRHF